MSTEFGRAYLTVSFFAIALISIAGCGPEPQQRPVEASEIKSNFVAFSIAVTVSNWPVMRTYLCQDWEKIYLRDKLFYQNDLIHASYPTTNAFVDFYSPTQAWLRIQSGTIENIHVGVGFLKETNGWKISGELLPIVD